MSARLKKSKTNPIVSKKEEITHEVDFRLAVQDEFDEIFHHPCPQSQ
jgi:hypothetical protein